MGRKRQQSAAECTDFAPDPLEWGAYIIRPDDQKYTDLWDAPNEPGIYGWYTKDRELMYIGKSTAIHTRLRQHAQGTFFWGGRPTYFSFRVVPSRWMSGVENAHLRVLEPIENKWRDTWSVPFQNELEAAIGEAWREALPVQRASLDRKYHELAEQIASRL